MNDNTITLNFEDHIDRLRNVSHFVRGYADMVGAMEMGRTTTASIDAISNSLEHYAIQIECLAGMIASDFRKATENE